MTATKKVLLATVIVSAGYGLATLLGAPTQAPFSWRPQIAAARHNVSAQASLSAPNSTSNAGRWALGGPQLIPDARPPEPAQDESAVKPLTPTADQSSDSSFALENVSTSPPRGTTAPNQPAQRAIIAVTGPRATLRNEAPRPVAAEPRAPVIVKSLAPIPRAGVETANTIQLLSPPAQTATSLTPAQFAGDISPSGATAMSYQPVIGDQQIATAIAPPPFPPVENLDEPRTHIIIDGDSLAKLAGRYLDDPHRGDEIYELNRHLLQDPELLPIGAEIEIPPRDNAARVSAESPHSYLPPGTAIHAAARGGGLVPVRPIPASARVMPRAQLTTPLPVE